LLPSSAFFSSVFFLMFVSRLLIARSVTNVASWDCNLFSPSSIDRSKLEIAFFPRLLQLTIQAEGFDVEERLRFVVVAGVAAALEVRGDSSSKARSGGSREASSSTSSCK
jgi:hypothetical protein